MGDTVWTQKSLCMCTQGNGCVNTTLCHWCTHRFLCVDTGLSCVRACSHEPGTVNYPGVMAAPGQALPRVHMMICCPGSTPLARGKFIVIWSLRIHLNSFSFYTNHYREWTLNKFTYFWCLLELFIGKFILKTKASPYRLLLSKDQGL